MQIDSSPEVVQWLRHHPSAATIEWGEDGLSANRPYASRAADPVVADCPVMWPWHVIGPDEPELQTFGSATLVVEYDLDVYELWPTGPCTGPLGAWITEVDRALDVVSTRELAELRELPGTFLVLSGGWWPRRISSALEAWARSCADRPDIRFRWNPDQKSAVLTTFGRYARNSKLAGAVSRKWAALYPVPHRRPVRPETATDDVDGRSERKGLRIAHARRWARRMRVDPALAWISAAEAGVLADLDPQVDVYGWAARHRIPTSAGSGIEPVLAAVPVLALAQNGWT